jgi:ATP/maltotriose-dependent transcriptional regulator MalT
VHAERGLAVATEIEARYPAYFATGVLGRIALAEGDLERAERSFRDASSRAASQGLRPFAAWWALGLGDVALARGELDGATDHARAALAMAEQTGNRRDAARACTLLALVAISHSDHELAITELTAALAIHREVVDVPGIKRSLTALIDALAASGRGERADRIAAAVARGAGTLDEATALALRGHGAKQREPATGWGGLTRAEAEVAELAAAGASNPEIGERLFMSRSTVKTHLSRVYAKLQVASRTELAASLAPLRARHESTSGQVADVSPRPPR